MVKICSNCIRHLQRSTYSEEFKEEIKEKEFDIIRLEKHAMRAEEKSKVYREVTFELIDKMILRMDNNND